MMLSDLLPKIVRLRMSTFPFTIRSHLLDRLGGVLEHLAAAGDIVTIGLFVTSARSDERRLRRAGLLFAKTGLQDLMRKIIPAIFQYGAEKILVMPVPKPALPSILRTLLRDANVDLSAR